MWLWDNNIKQCSFSLLRQRKEPKERTHFDIQEPRLGVPAR